MNDHELLTRITAANPVRAEDLAGAAHSPHADQTLHDILTHRARPARRRRTLLLATVPALAAATTAAVLLAGTAIPGPGPRPAPTAETPLRGGLPVLLTAAEHAAGQQVHPTGRYWQVSSSTVELLWLHFRGHRFAARVTWPTGLWLPRDPHQNTISEGSGGSMTYVPLTPADLAAYRAGGSPTRNENTAVGLYVPDPPSLTWLLGEHIFEFDGTLATPKWPVGRDVSDDPRKLPADPVRLRTALLEGVRKAGGPPDHLNAWLFLEGARLLLPDSLLYPPAFQAAGLRMLATIPGVRDLGTVRDPLGHPAAVVALTDHSAEWGTVEWQVLIHPTTGTLLGVRAVVLKHGSENTYATPGTIQYSDTIQFARWTKASPPR